ncbi:MAG: ADP-ribosylglycohydrolase family protein [Malacoplasma sp.]|nr:ADP-ribosylglycohydrolase family protein [Malacoplasma sp.]
MLGALIGDCTGSYYEDQYLGDNDLRNKPKYKDVQIMKGNITDDSILTIAIADALLQCHNNYDNLEVFYFSFYIT